ncbi:DUF6543 domain-containing protein [Pseudomonas sp. SIMBA_077]
MNDLTHAEAGPATLEAPALAHADFIASQLPEWVKQAPQAIRTALRSSLLKSNQSRHDLSGLMADVQCPLAFSKPLFEQALQHTFRGALDDKKHLFVRDLKNSHLFGLIKIHVAFSVHPLLEAAMQNFQASEAEDGGLESGTGLFTNTSPDRKPLTISATRFAGMCRELNLGAQYQHHLDEILTPLPASASVRTRDQVKQLFAQKEQDDFEVALHIALIRDTLSHAVYQQLLSLQEHGQHSDWESSHLTINGVALPNVLVFTHRSVAHQILLYTPHDPLVLFRQHTSLDELKSELANRLLTPDYMAFFNQLVPHRYRGTLFTVSTASPGILPGKYAQSAVHSHIDQWVALTDIQCNVFDAIAQQQINQIKSYGRALVVSTAAVDIRAREQRLEHYREAGKTLLFFAASFVPIVGEVLLAVTAAQLISTVYHGFEAWSRGDSDEALNCLMDVVDNVALAVVTVGAIKTSGFTAGLIKVKLRNQSPRLWSPDLTPYRHLQGLPEGAVPDEYGLYEHDKHLYIKLDEHLHKVAYDSQAKRWQLHSPYAADGYTPNLLTNGQGNWRMEHENPKDWDLLKRLKRLSHQASYITQPKVAAILHVADEDGSTLLQLHQEMLHPPPLLSDAIKRFKLDEEINTFNLDHADGKQLAPHTPLMQFYLTTRLPEWPQNRMLRVIDSQQNTVLVHGSAGSDLKVPLARFTKGELLHVLEEQLPADVFDSLTAPIKVPAEALPYFSSVEKLAIRLTDELAANKQQLLKSIYAQTETPTSLPEEYLHNLRPELSKSYREEIIKVLNHEEYLQLLQKHPLNELQHWEADRYVEQLNASRMREGLFLDSACPPESVTTILSVLGQLPGWPASHQIEIRSDFSFGKLHGSAGDVRDAGRFILTPKGDLYTAHHPTGEPIGSATDVFTAIEHTLTQAQRTTLFELTQATTLKQAVGEHSLRSANASLLPVRVVRPSVLPSSSPGYPLDPHFADPAPPKDLTLRADGVYEASPGSDGFFRHFVLEGEQYFRVKSDKWGWQLIDARSPSRAYKPYVRRNVNGTWEIDAHKGKLLGGMPDSPSMRRSADASEGEQSHSPSGGLESTDDDFETAESSDEYLSADESFAPEPYTALELIQMRSNESYQHSQNYRRRYNRANNGRYPIRDIDGQPLRIRLIQATSKSLTSEIKVPKNKLIPYIQWEGYEKVARLYEEKMELATFAATHMKSPLESALIGEKTVVARRTLTKGEVLGLYGGELLPKSVAVYRKDPYLLSAEPHHLPKHGAPGPSAISRDVLLSGDNITSRINTIFEYEDGLPVRQAVAGYNVEGVPFDMHVQKGTEPMQRLQLTALIINEVIPMGTELRWDYQYSEQAIKKLFGKAPA